MMTSFSKKLATAVDDTQWKKEGVSSDLWFSKNFSDLPEFKLLPLDSSIFASYSGPDCGLAFIQNIENETNGKLVAGCHKWNLKNRKAYGISMSLYDQHPINGKITGDPIADCFGLCARGNSALMVVADGVNWGEKSRLAARCAVYGAMKSINERLFPSVNENFEKCKSKITEDCENEREEINAKDELVDGATTVSMTEMLGIEKDDDAKNITIETTKDLLKLMLASLESAHKMILKHQGGLTTLCICLVCPIMDYSKDSPDDMASEAPYSPIKKYAACVINVGDSLAFVFSRRHGVREITTGSHDVTLERNIRDAGGAIGPVSETGEPELNNLTCSITCVEAGDVVFLATDGITDNFDPVVTKIAVAKKVDVNDAPPTFESNICQERKETMGNFDCLQKKDNESNLANESKNDCSCESESKIKDFVKDSSSATVNADIENMAKDISNNISLEDKKDLNKEPSVTCHEFMLPNKCSSFDNQDGRKSIEVKPESSSIKDTFPEEIAECHLSEIENVKSNMEGPGLENGKPVMLPFERHRYAIKEMERVIHEFELFTESPCSAQELCGALLQHVLRLTDPKRKVLENPDLYGKKKRLKAEERQNRDSEIILKLAQSPGKLDHATVLGYEVGCYHGNEDENYYSD